MGDSDLRSENKKARRRKNTDGVTPRGRIERKYESPSERKGEGTESCKRGQESLRCKSKEPHGTKKGRGLRNERERLGKGDLPGISLSREKKIRMGVKKSHAQPTGRGVLEARDRKGDPQDLASVKEARLGLRTRRRRLWKSSRVRQGGGQTTRGEEDGRGGLQARTLHVGEKRFRRDQEKPGEGIWGKVISCHQARP